MALQVWLPLNKDTRNIGLLPYSEPSCDGITIIDDISPNGNSYGRGSAVYHCDASKIRNQWTIATWAKSSSWRSESNDIIACKNIAASNHCQFYFSQIGGKLNIGINGGTSSFSVTTDFTNNVWRHYAATYDGETARLYADGVLLGTKKVTTAELTDCTNIGIGCRSNNQDGTSMTTGVNKDLFDFRIYNHVLQDWEIKKLYNSLALEIAAGLHLEESENINSDPDRTIHASSFYNGGNSKYNYNDASNAKREIIVDGGVKCAKVSPRSATTAFYPYIFFQPIHPASGAYKTLSFDYYPTQQSYIIPYSYGGAGNVKLVLNRDEVKERMNTTAIEIPNVKVGEWNHIDMTLQGTTSATTGWGYIRLGRSKFSVTTDDYWLFKNVQVTNKDHAIPYSLSNRDERFVDLSLNDSDIVPYNVVQSGSSLYLNGTDAAIQVPIESLINGGTWTLNVWFYRPTGMWGTKGWETIIGGPSGFEFMTKRSTTNSPVLVAYSWGQGSEGGTVYECDKWNMLTIVRTPSQFKYYLNGVSAYTSTSVGSIRSGNYFVGSWSDNTKQNFRGYIRRFSAYKKALTDEDIMNLYIHNE